MTKDKIKIWNLDNFDFSFILFLIYWCCLGEVGWQKGFSQTNGWYDILDKADMGLFFSPGHYFVVYWLDGLTSSMMEGLAFPNIVLDEELELI